MQIIVEMKENLMAKVVYLGIKSWWHMLHTSYKILYYPQWIRLFFPVLYWPKSNSDFELWVNKTIVRYITF